MYLDYLHLLFQTQRLLHRQTQQALPALLEVSVKLLSTSLVSSTPNNRMYETRRHFPTMLLFYCFPAAGLLALELRKCTIQGVSLPSTVTRADVIRNLSVLTSCLEWIVLPGDGNHKLCSELNKMLAVVLDEVLNYEPSANDGLENADDLAGSGQGFFDMPMINGLEPIPTGAEDFLDWLDNATWNNPVSLRATVFCLAVNSYAGPLLNQSIIMWDPIALLWFEILKCTTKSYLCLMQQKYSENRVQDEQ